MVDVDVCESEFPTEPDEFPTRFWLKLKFQLSLSVLTRVLTSVYAIHSCVVVATQCMHDAVSLAACCVFVRPPPSWAHQWLLRRGSPIDPTIAPVVSVRSIDSFVAICSSDYGNTRSPEARHQSGVSFPIFQIFNLFYRDPYDY